MVSKLLATLASCIHISAFVIYNLQILNGTAHPNTASWAIWTFLTILNFASYRSMSGDWVKSILPSVSSLATIFTFAFVLCIGRTTPLDAFDRIVFLAGILAAFAWWKFHSATFANLTLQACAVVGAIPTFRILLRDPSAENPLCWWMWAAAYLITNVVVLLRWRKQSRDLAYPVTCLVLNASIAAIALAW